MSLPRRSARVAALLLVAGVAVAACGSSAPSVAPASPRPSAAAAPSAAASASPAASGAAPASAGPSGAASSAPAGSAQAGGDLKAMLPTTIAGVPLTLAEITGEQLAGSAAVSQQMIDLLASIGRTPADLTMATADDPRGRTDMRITAFRVRDLPIGTFLDKYLPVLRAAYTDGAVTQGTRASRNVWLVKGSGQLPSQVLLPSNDVLFVVMSTNDSLVDQVLAQLP